MQQIYDTELGGGRGRPPALRRIMILEVSQYLERFLWPHFDAEHATPEHVLSIMLMVNEKFREGVITNECVCVWIMEQDVLGVLIFVDLLS